MERGERVVQHNKTALVTGISRLDKGKHLSLLDGIQQEEVL
jgi:hypothetical protein